jgi:hypothetical protein
MFVLWPDFFRDIYINGNSKDREPLPIAIVRSELGQLATTFAINTQLTRMDVVSDA